ncbi:HipA domain-containing protein [Rhodoferax sp.]|uniref:HipA domain-containing protein n=1 Tax=Rhodoferax sp. TaxID=50421 RepID=UPI0026142E02|nr:HipA domain-containing protein [Rhodoferax sp.]MDD2927180.1 HipA domain-containing protein [Rhodoferax sp.]
MSTLPRCPPLTGCTCQRRRSLIERFDRVRAPGDAATQRIHIIDTCQLLNKSRAFKYQQANLQTLAEAIKLCRQKAAARIQLYRWLLFNVLVGNGCCRRPNSAAARLLQSLGASLG